MRKTVSIFSPCRGEKNMLLDQEILSQADDQIEKNVPSCYVRIYEWDRPTISFGIGQRSYRESVIDAKYRGKIDLVDRMTGGRAVLHHQEITYSIAAPTMSEIFPSSLHGSYLKIADILMAFLRKMGISAQLVDKSRSLKSFNRSSLVCYDLSGLGEIVVQGSKLIGSAQKRGQHTFLQHGSIPFYRHDLRLNRYLKQEYRSDQRDEGVFVSDFTSMKIAVAKNILRETFLERL